jgi:mono/diheme cytochrome c family protein
MDRLVEIVVAGMPSRSVAADPTWTRLSVELPMSTRTFPQGEGSAIANSQCLICHSAGMVLLQPQRTQAQWVETINKMHTAYGVPLPTEQVDALAAYLTRVVGRQVNQDLQRVFR